MGKLKKILFIIFIVVLLFSCLAYIDYFYAKRKNTHPKLAIKNKIDNDLVVYNAAFYRVWYCKTNKVYTFGNYDDVDAVCSKNYNYKNDYYTNSSNIKISKKNLEMINKIYTSEMIENMSDESSVENAVYVASNYGKSVYKEVVDESGVGVKANNYQLVSFPVFELNENGNYEWIYNNTEQYCLNDKDEVALLLNNECGEFKKIKMEEQWCKLYINSTLAYDPNATKLCEE